MLAQVAASGLNSYCRWPSWRKKRSGPQARVIKGYKGPQRKVLVVDDISSNRDILVDLLEPVGFKVVEAKNGQQAVQFAKEMCFDLILMDRWMPVMDGLEAVKQISRMAGRKSTTIIAVSASVSEEDQALSKEMGYDGFLPKPINWTKLAAMIEEYLRLEWIYEERPQMRSLKDKQNL